MSGSDPIEDDLLAQLLQGSSQSALSRAIASPGRARGALRDLPLRLASAPAQPPIPAQAPQHQPRRRLPGPAGRLEDDHPTAARDEDRPHAGPSTAAAAAATAAAASGSIVPSATGELDAAASTPAVVFTSWRPPPPETAGPPLVGAWFDAWGPWTVACTSLDIPRHTARLTRRTRTQRREDSSDFMAGGQGDAADDDDDDDDPWPRGCHRPPHSLISLLASGQRSVRSVPVVVAVVVGLNTSVDSDTLLRLRDPSGSMIACCERQVTDEAGPRLALGACLVLRGVSVFSPSPATRYLNIVSEAVLQVFPPWTRPAPDRPPVAAV